PVVAEATGWRGPARLPDLALGFPVRSAAGLGEPGCHLQVDVRRPEPPRRHARERPGGLRLSLPLARFLLVPVPEARHVSALLLASPDADDRNSDCALKPRPGPRR